MRLTTHMRGLPLAHSCLCQKICQTTGWGGQPVRAPGHGDIGGDGNDDLASRLQPVTDAKRMRVTFNASVSDILPWKFVPQQREVRVLPGETALAFYTATNKSDKDIIGVATYSVTPAQVAPYFSKIQCFCFEEQRLSAGETVDMPVFFYLDPDMLNDLNMKGIETVTLSYTFFSEFLLLSKIPRLGVDSTAASCERCCVLTWCRGKIRRQWDSYRHPSEVDMRSSCLRWQSPPPPTRALLRLI
jgi:cytochrome c oxidase assembly protein Cox11